ncbi:MAG: AI-2E family transporter [Bacteriovoracaceae bacterium]
MKDNLIKLVVENFFKISFALSMIVLFIYIMMPFMVAIILGGILAMALAPFVEYFIRRGLKRSTSLMLFSFLVGLIGLVPVVAFFIRGSRLMTNLLHQSNFQQLTQQLQTSSLNFIDHFCSIYGLDKTMVNNKIISIITYVGTSLSGIFSDLVIDLPNIFLTGFVTILSLYCFLSQSDKIRFLFDRYFHFKQQNGDAFIRMIKICCREVFFSNIITGILQATVVSMGALIFSAGDVFLVFFITFFVSFIPIIGAAPVAAVLAILCFIESRFGPGIGMLVVAGVSGISDNVIRPLLGSLGVVEVHPFIGLLAVIGGVIMFGLPGLFIGPLVASLIFGALPIIIEEYFPHTKDMNAI